MNEEENIFLPGRKANSFCKDVLPIPLRKRSFSESGSSSFACPDEARHYGHQTISPAVASLSHRRTGGDLPLAGGLRRRETSFQRLLELSLAPVLRRAGAGALAHGTVVGCLRSSSGAGLGTVRRQRRPGYTPRVDRLGVSSTICLVQNSCIEKRTREVFCGSRRVTPDIGLMFKADV